MRLSFEDGNPYEENPFLRERAGFYQPPPWTNIAWNEKKGALYFFGAKDLHIFKPRPPFGPTCMKKQQDRAGWTFCRGDGRADLNIICGLLVAERRRIAEAKAKDPEATVYQDRITRVYTQFLKALDPDALKVVMAAQLPDGTWPAYCLAARIPETRQRFFAGHPVLAMALSRTWCFLPRVQGEFRRIRRLAKQKPKVLAESLGFGSGRTATRAMARLPRASLSLPNLLNLRQALTAPEVGVHSKFVRHLDRLNSGALFLLRLPASLPDLRGRLSYGFIEEVAHNEHYDARTRSLGFMLRDLVARLGDRLPQISSLSRLHDVYAEYGDGPFGPEVFETELPSGPYADEGKTITSIHRPRDIWAWGHRQHNCLRTHLDQFVRAIERGLYAVYRVQQAGKTASIGLRYVEDNDSWHMDQFFGPANSDPDPGMLKTVDTWLEKRRTEHFAGQWTAFARRCREAALQEGQQLWLPLRWAV